MFSIFIIAVVIHSISRSTHPPHTTHQLHHQSIRMISFNRFTNASSENLSSTRFLAAFPISSSSFPAPAPPLSFTLLTLFNSSTAVIASQNPSQLCSTRNPASLHALPRPARVARDHHRVKRHSLAGDHAKMFVFRRVNHGHRRAHQEQPHQVRHAPQEQHLAIDFQEVTTIFSAPCSAERFLLPGGRNLPR